jgi:hypothetical protein
MRIMKIADDERNSKKILMPQQNEDLGLIEGGEAEKHREDNTQERNFDQAFESRPTRMMDCGSGTYRQLLLNEHYIMREKISRLKRKLVETLRRVQVLERVFSTGHYLVEVTWTSPPPDSNFLIILKPHSSLPVSSDLFLPGCYSNVMMALLPVLEDDDPLEIAVELVALYPPDLVTIQYTTSLIFRKTHHEWASTDFMCGETRSLRIRYLLLYYLGRVVIR